MVYFACNQVDLEEIIKCSLDLSKTQYAVFDFLLSKRGRYTVKEISQELSLDRTTVQKAVKELLRKELVERFQDNLERGGYTFVYRIESKEKIKKRLRNIIRDWCKSAEKEIKEW